MAMNFWEAQKRAKSKTSLYMFCFILVTIGAAAFVEFAVRTIDPQDYSPPLPLIGILFMLITFLVAGYQYMMYGQFGGSYVAESVNGRLLDPGTMRPHERQLINIVEEMALAASVPVPPVYIIPAMEINAFAAGLHPHDAVIAVTQGSLAKLNRDELQGVVAHEFGHIHNGDMKISMRLAAMLMGFYFILVIGLRFLQITQFRSREKEGNSFALIALVLILAGAITWFFGTLLKSMVSREREYLADASSVQFTRNPEGIANALRKIQKETTADMPKSGVAISHMYLQDRSILSSLFATHPPIEKRIAAIEGREYIPEEWNIPA